MVASSGMIPLSTGRGHGVHLILTSYTVDIGHLPDEHLSTKTFQISLFFLQGYLTHPTRSNRQQSMYSPRPINSTQPPLLVLPCLSIGLPCHHAYTPPG